jgi:hypothetical protein
VETGFIFNANYAFIGASIGRTAGRIENGRFTLDGKDYQVAIDPETGHSQASLSRYSSAESKFNTSSLSCPRLTIRAPKSVTDKWKPDSFAKLIKTQEIFHYTKKARFFYMQITEKDFGQGYHLKKPRFFCVMENFLCLNKFSDFLIK